MNNRPVKEQNFNFSNIIYFKNSEKLLCLPCLYRGMEVLMGDKQYAAAVHTLK